MNISTSGETTWSTPAGTEQKLSGDRYVELECIPYSVFSLLMYELLCNHPISCAHACCKRAQSS